MSQPRRNRKPGKTSRPKKVIPKKVVKKSTTKKVTKSRPIKTTSRRGSNIIKLHASGTPDNLAKRLKGSNLQSKIGYRVRKNKPLKGAGYKAPKAVVLIYEVKTEEGETKVFSEISEPDFVVNTQSTLEYLIEKTDSANEFFEDQYGGTIDKVKSVSVKFIY